MNGLTNAGSAGGGLQVLASGAGIASAGSAYRETLPQETQVVIVDAYLGFVNPSEHLSALLFPAHNVAFESISIQLTDNKLLNVNFGSGNGGSLSYIALG